MLIDFRGRKGRGEKREREKWEMIFANTSSDKVLIFKIYKELIKSNRKREREGERETSM